MFIERITNRAILIAITTITSLLVASSVFSYAKMPQSTQLPIISQYMMMTYPVPSDVMNNAPYTEINRLYLFSVQYDNGTIDWKPASSTDTQDECWNNFNAIYTACTTANSACKIFVAMDPSADYSAMAQDQNLGSEIVTFLTKNQSNKQLSGIDLDWENDFSQSDMESVVTNIANAFNKYNESHANHLTLTMTLWLGMTNFINNAPTIYNNVSQFNCMSYTNNFSDYESTYNNFTNKLVAGVEEEFGYSYQNTKDIQDECTDANNGTIAGVFGWRMDNDSCSSTSTHDPAYTFTNLIYSDFGSPVLN